MTDYAYDDVGRLVSATTAAKATTYTYDPAGNLLSTALPNGQVEERTVDRGGRLSRIRAQKGQASLVDLDYSFDAAANPTAVRDRLAAPAAAATTRVSVSSAKAEANGESADPTLSLSGDGRFVVFHSSASNLVADDTNGVQDIFVHDRSTATTTRVSLGPAGAQANGVSQDPDISADGRYVAFSSVASNLAAGDTNGVEDIFVHDRNTATTNRASVGSSGAEANGYSNNSEISADGRHLSFQSASTNLVAGDNNGQTDVFVRDLAASTNSLVSVSSAGAAGNAASAAPSISADGRYVVFRSLATTLVPGDTNAVQDTFVRDRTAGTTRRVSVSSAGLQADGSSGSYTSISADGRRVAFHSTATNLVAGDTNGVDDVFVHDTARATTVRASVSSAGEQANATSINAVISGDGSAVVFQSTATNLVASDTNQSADAFVYELAGGTSRVSLTSSGAQSPRGGGNTHISYDGRSVAFYSRSALVPGDSNGLGDVFVANRAYDTQATYRYDSQQRLVDACFEGGCRTGADAYARYAYDPVGNRTKEERAGGTTTYA